MGYVGWRWSSSDQLVAALTLEDFCPLTFYYMLAVNKAQGDKISDTKLC